MRPTRGSRARILLCRVDVKSAFRQGLVDSAGTPAFIYDFGDHVAVDLRLKFGWRNHARLRASVASPLEHAHTRSTLQGADLPQQGGAAILQVELPSPRGSTICCLERLWTYSWSRGLVQGAMAFSSSCKGGPRRPPLLACCTVAGVGPYSLVERTWGVRSAPPVRQKTN